MSEHGPLSAVQIANLDRELTAYVKRRRLRNEKRNAAPPPLATRAVQATRAIYQNLRGTNQRPAEEIRRIAALCRHCDQRSRHGFCNICWCSLSQKIRNAGTACPVGKWGPTET